MRLSNITNEQNKLPGQKKEYHHKRFDKKNEFSDF